MYIFSTIKLNDRTYFLTDEQARYILKESVYVGKTSRYHIYYDPYYDINGNKYPTFSMNGIGEYVEDPNGKFLRSPENEYYNPIEGKPRFKRDCQYVIDEHGAYVYDSTRGTFVNPYNGRQRYRTEGEFTWEEYNGDEPWSIDNENGRYLYDPLLENNNGFYLPYYDKTDYTVKLPRFIKVPIPETGEFAYIEHDAGPYIYDVENDTYYNPMYQKDHQNIPEQRYTIGSNLIYVEDDEGELIYDELVDTYYNPYAEGIKRYAPSDELSTFSPADDDPIEGRFILVDAFDKDARPNFGFYNEFPEFNMDKGEFVLGSEDIFVVDEEEHPDYITDVHVADADLEEGSIDRINGQPLKDTSKMRSSEYIQLSGGQKYSIVNDNDYWMQIFEYKFDEVLQDYIFIKSYKVTYGLLFKLSNLTTHIKFASGDGNTTDLTNVRIRLVSDDHASSYVFTGPIYETFDEAYQAGYYYFFDSNDRTQFCRLIGDGKNCQAYERYQISTAILKQVSEIEDATNRALSRITQTGAEITMEVKSMDRDLRSYIQQQMNVIRLEVIDGDNGLHTQIQLTADAISSMATSEFVILGHGNISAPEIEYSIENPDNFGFSDLYPKFDGENFVLDPERTIYTDFASAYDAGYVYFNPGTSYMEDPNGRFILNGTYYMPYVQEILNGGHRYVKIVKDDGSIGYEIDDEKGPYILEGTEYINPYAKYPRYEEYKTFGRLTYNMVDGYGYDVYTSSNHSLKTIIEQTASQIRLEVSDSSGELIGRLITTAEEIAASVTNLRNETESKIRQTSENISAAVASGGSDIVRTDASLANGVDIFYSARPILKDGEFEFNLDYMAQYENAEEALADEHYYFEYPAIYIEYSNGDYIINPETGAYYNPYAGATRYMQVVDSGQEREEDKIRYVQNPNGRYIRNADRTYSDPYLGKTRYIKEPAYCEIVDEDGSYTVNLLVSSKHRNQSQINLTSKEVAIEVTDTSGAMSSIAQTANTIKAQVASADERQISIIEQSSDRIMFNTLSSLLIISSGNTIPQKFYTSANTWYEVPPYYRDGQIIYNENRSKNYTSHIFAYEEGYTYVAGDPTYKAVANGRYILDSNGNYYNPYNATRFNRYIKTSFEDSYIEDPNGSYVLNDDGEYESIYNSKDIGESARYSKVSTKVETVTYEESETGKYVLAVDGTTYIDPYEGKTRYELYPTFYHLSMEGEGENKEYLLIQYAFVQSQNEAKFEQTAESMKMTIDSEETKRKSELSLTTEEFRTELTDLKHNTNSKIYQNADKIGMIVSSSVDKVVAVRRAYVLPAFDALYSAAPTFDRESRTFNFDDPDYIAKYKYPDSDPVEAYAEGFGYFANYQDEFVEDPNGSYIQLANGNYYNPYEGATRYRRDYYDNDSEGVDQVFSYILDDGGRYLYDAETNSYYDPYYDRNTGLTYVRYSMIPYESETGIKTYNLLTAINSTITKYKKTVRNEAGDIQIPAGDVYLSIADKIYKITTNQSIYEGFEVSYDLATKVISYGNSGVDLQTFGQDEYEIVESIPEDAQSVTDFIAERDNEYVWETHANLSDVNRTAIEQSTKEIRLTVNDEEGYSSQIRQAADNITSIVKGAPLEIKEVTGTEALAVLAAATKFYVGMPKYNDAEKKFDFESASMNGTCEDALKRNFRFFEGDANTFVEDVNGEYIRTVYPQPPVYRYYNPRVSGDFGDPFVRLGYEEPYVYLPYSGDDPENDPDAVWFYDAESGQYFNPYEDGIHTERFVYDPFTDTYTEDPDGPYIRDEIPQEPVYWFHRPYYNEETGAMLTRYRLSWDEDSDGILIHVDGLPYDTPVEDTFVDPFEGKTKYIKIANEVQSLEGLTYTHSESNFYAIKDDETNEYYDPFYQQYDQTVPVYRYTAVNDRVGQGSSENTVRYVATLMSPSFEDYVIDPITGAYYQPFKTKQVYNVQYALEGSSGTLNIIGENDRYYYENNNYINPYANSVTRYTRNPSVDPNGRYILVNGEYVDPFEGIDSLLYSKYPTYGKFFYNGEYIVKYYTRIADQFSTKIEQTGNMIRISISDDTASTNTYFLAKNGEITQRILNIRDGLDTAIKVLSNQIMAYIHDVNANMHAEVKINADSIDNIVSGSYICTGSSPISDAGSNIILYNEVPVFDYDRNEFRSRGYSKSYDTTSYEDMCSAIDEGYLYFIGDPIFIECARSEAFYYKHPTTGLITPIDAENTYRIRYSAKYDPETNESLIDRDYERYQASPILTENINVDTLDEDSYVYSKIGTAFVKINKWYKEVKGYKKVYNTHATEDITSIKVYNYILSEEKFTSLIHQEASNIQLFIKDENDRIRSGIAITDSQIRAHVDDVENNLSASIKINADSIEGTVTGSHIRLLSDNVVPGLTVIGYSSIPVWNGSRFSQKEDVSNKEVTDQSDIDEGYSYSDGMTEYISCHPTDATIFQIDGSYSYNSVLTGLPRYRKAYSVNSDEQLIEIYEEDNIDGIYINTGTDSEPNYELAHWFKQVGGYYKYTEVRSSDGAIIGDFYIRSEDDYTSKIKQSANEINLYVKKMNSFNQAGITIVEDSIKAYVDSEDEKLRSSISINAGNIQSVVQNTVLDASQFDSYIDPDEYPDGYIPTILCNMIPSYNNGSFNYSGNTRTVGNSENQYEAAIADGFKYAVDNNTIYYIPCGSSEADVFVKPNDTQYTAKATSPAYIINTYEKVYLYEEDGSTREYYRKSVDGNYVITGMNYNSTTIGGVEHYYETIAGSVFKVPTWYKCVNSSYRIYTSYGAYIAYINFEEGIGSSITQTLDKITMSVDDLYNGTKSIIDAGNSRIALLVTTGGEVRAGIIVDAINSAATSVSISADHINLNGYVTVSSYDSLFGIMISNGEIACVQRVNVNSSWSTNDAIWKFGRTGSAGYGYIGGWNIKQNMLSSGNITLYSGSSYKGTSLISGTSNIRIFVSGYALTTTASTNTSHANFMVLDDGSVYAKNAHIEGHIEASSGTIGSFAISGAIKSITGGNSMSSYNDRSLNTNNTSYIYLGTDGISSYKINSDGAKSMAYMSGGEIYADNMRAYQISGIANLDTDYLTVKYNANINWGDFKNGASFESKIWCTDISADSIGGLTNYLDFSQAATQTTIEITLSVTSSFTGHVTLTTNVPIKNSHTVTVYYTTKWGNSLYQSVTIWPNGSNVSSVTVELDNNTGIRGAGFDTSLTQTKYYVTEYNSSRIAVHGDFVPESGDIYSLGVIGKYWKELRANTVYNASGAITNSDANKKNSIEIIPEKYDEFFDLLSPTIFKYNDGTSNRFHTGFIANEVEKSLNDTGITNLEFAGFCEWETADGGTECGLRYEEFVSINTWQIQKLKKRIAELEDQVQELLQQSK